MKRFRFALACLVLGLAASARPASASSDCPNIFYHPSTGSCGMTGRTQGCICEYECSLIEEPQWFNFCG